MRVVGERKVASVLPPGPGGLQLAAVAGGDFAPLPRSAESTIVKRVLSPLLTAVCEAGGTLDALLAGFDLEGACEPDGRLQTRVWYALLDRALEVSERPELGLLWARASAACGKIFGLVGYLAKSSPTLGSAIDMLVRYSRLFQDDLVFECAREGKTARLRLWHSQDTRLPTIWTEGVLAYCHLAARHFARCTQQEAWRPLAVSFAHPGPRDRTPYELLFRAPVEFEASEDAIVFSCDWLDFPMASADPSLFLLLEDYARQQLSQLPYLGGDIRRRVRTVLMRELDGGNPTKEHVACVLRLSPRTLTRRLAEAGSTFEDVLATLRCELSVRYLRDTHLSVSEIAMALGFSSTSSFVRAFRRWTGRAPGELRLLRAQ